MKNQGRMLLAAIFLMLFIVWTCIVCFVDVQEIGPRGSKVGLATLNSAFHDMTGVHMSLYTITDWLGLVPIAVALVFATLGFVQLCKRRSILNVDQSILALGGFYIVTILAYVLFEYVVINYRPVLIDGYLEASYPSSTTMLVLCLMPTTAMQTNERVKNKTLKLISIFAIILFTAFMVVGRMISGVHWLSDIIGGILLSAGLVTAYSSIYCKDRV